MHRALEFRLFASCPVVGDSVRVLFKNWAPNFCEIIKKYKFDQVLINHPSEEHDQYIKLKLKAWLCNKVQSKENQLIYILLICINYV